MHTLTDAAQVQEWKDYMKEYSAKRKQLGYTAEVLLAHQAPHITTFKEIKAREYQFDTVVAQFRDPSREAAAAQKENQMIDFKRKHVKVPSAHQEFLDTKSQGFDIITLEQQKSDLPSAEDKLTKKRILPKAQVAYNILTNGDFPEYHWTGVERPAEKKEYKKKVHMDAYRDFNIVSNEYWEGHNEKATKDLEATKQVLSDKYKAALEFNPLIGSYYDAEKEKEFLEERVRKEAQHGKEYLQRLPPTLRVRETIVFDQNKPIPEEVKRFDELRKNQKKRYEKRHQLEQEYRDLDVAQQDSTEQKVLNRFHGDKFFEEKYKGFDNFTLTSTKEQVQQLSQHAHMKPKLGLWEQIQAGAEEPLTDRTAQARERAIECTIDKTVTIDQLPLYSRDPAAPPLPPVPQEPREPAFDSLAPLQPFERALRSDDPRATPVSPHAAHPDLLLRSEIPSLKPTEDLQPQPRSRPSDPGLRLYNPDLARDQQAFSRHDGLDVQSKKSNSLANGDAPKAPSRNLSGLSNGSRLSFASAKSSKSSSSHKLPSLGRPLQLPAYNPPLPEARLPVPAGPRRSQQSSSAAVQPLAESGGFN